MFWLLEEVVEQDMAVQSYLVVVEQEVSFLDQDTMHLEL